MRLVTYRDALGGDCGVLVKIMTHDWENLGFIPAINKITLREPANLLLLSVRALRKSKNMEEKFLAAWVTTGLNK